MTGADAATLLDQDRFPELSPGILFAETRDGGVVYDLITEQLSFLNSSGAALCDACAKAKTVDATISLWADAAGIDVEVVRGDVAGALEDFVSSGLVARDQPIPRTYPPDAPVTTLGEADAATVQAVGVHRLRFTGTDAALVNRVAERLGLGCDDEPTAEFRIVPEADATIRLITDTEWHFASAETLIDRIAIVVNDFVARTRTDAVLHAAAMITPAGQTVVFPAASGSGKSTIAGLLAQRGWAYLGDESATIRSGDLAVAPCAKPLDLDPVSCGVLGLPADTAGDVALSLIAPGAKVVTAPTSAPAAIVIPRYVGTDGEPGTAILDVTEALVTLVGNTLNLRYVGTPGLETLVELAASVPVHTIAYRSSDEALEQLAGKGLGSS